MADKIDNIEERIALARRNIQDLTEQATGAAGAASEDRIANRISDQQEILNELLRQRESHQRNGPA